jgi:predicted ABC-type ATPase
LRRLDLIVGPNGSGKTTFGGQFLAPSLPPSAFVNADEIARVRWPDDPAAHAYEAAQVAQKTRAALIAGGHSFIAETVFSHPSKVQLVRDAKQAGYTVILHVLLVPEELAVLRVAYRVRAGGHDVPEQKIRERYQRLWANVALAAALADRAVFYDNSKHEGPRIVAELTAGMSTDRAQWPAWTPQPLRTLTTS